MSWRETSIMEQREEFVRLASADGANRRELCRRFGISAPTGYKWLRRFAAGEALRDRSRRPASSPNQTGSKLETAILAVRDAHPAWGARKLAAVLERRGSAAPAPSTVHAILRRNDRVIETLGQGKAYTRFEMAAPNQLAQMDFKGWTRFADGTRCHPLAMIDDHSRYLLCLEPCLEQTEETVRRHVEQTFRHHGLPERLYVDNGTPWGSSGGEYWTRFAVWLLKLGIGVVHSRPYHPQGRGKNERFNGTLNVEVLSLRTFLGLDDARLAFRDWRRVYNHERPHEALGMAVPADRYRPSARAWPDRLMEPEYDEGEIVRKVGTTKAYIQFQGRSWHVGAAFCGERLALRPRGKDGQFGVFFGAHEIRTIDLNEV